MLFPVFVSAEVFVLRTQFLDAWPRSCRIFSTADCSHVHGAIERLMICYKDQAFCASSDCTNQCGRKLTEEVKAAARRAKLPLSVGYFCGKPEWHEPKDDKQKEQP